MLNSRIEKYLYNPVVGLFPLLLVLLLIESTPIGSAIDISLSVCAVMTVISLLMMGIRVFQIFFLSSFLSLLFFNIVHIMLPNYFENIYPNIILELTFLIVIWGIKIYENRMLKYVDDNLKIGLKIHLKPALQIYFFITRVFIIFLIIHISVLLIIVQFYEDSISEISLVWIKSLFPIFILIVAVIEFLDIRWIGKQINKERYLPIIDASSRVIGHIAMSEVETFDKKFQHPIVRILFKCRNRLYLKERPRSFGFETGRVDLPIEDFLEYGENLDDAVKRVVRSYFGRTKIEPCFMLKYAFDNSERKSLNYLYIVGLQEEKIESIRSLKGGKWWIESQIVENIGKKYFSSAFESEFEYIQSTVLMAEKYN